MCLKTWQQSTPRQGRQNIVNNNSPTQTGCASFLPGKRDVFAQVDVRSCFGDEFRASTDDGLGCERGRSAPDDVTTVKKNQQKFHKEPD